MIRLTILLVFAIGFVNSQLNFEGNPLTENTEYTAEESHLSQRMARNEGGSADLSNSPASTYPQKLYPISEMEGDKRTGQLVETYNVLSERSQEQALTAGRSNLANASARQLHESQVSYDENAPINPAELALNTFLNSQTPEESRMSLDFYLQSQSPENPSQSSNTLVNQERKSIERVDVEQQPVVQVEQRQPLLPRMDQQVQLRSQADQEQLLSRLVPQVNQREQSLQSAGQRYGYMGQPVGQAIVQPAVRSSAGTLGQGILQPVPLVTGFQVANDIVAPTIWRQRMRKIRGKPFPFAQSRIAPGLYKGPFAAVPFKHKAPVEVIYTKPPGILQRGPPILSNPPIPYEDASAWFPDSDYPPPSKDVFYSQLYSQSYDPHYYNYIATTGKIRPHLYGKLGKRKEEQDDGIWSELYRGFTKHGLKNIMTPTFLLGMTLPVVTLMLSALVQKRSIARSNARQSEEEDVLREHLERLQRAMECYANKNSPGANLEKC